MTVNLYSYFNIYSHITPDNFIWSTAPRGLMLLQLRCLCEDRSSFTVRQPFVFATLSLSLSLFLSTSLCLFPTFLAEGDGVVHDPADQSHEQPQQNEEDPVLSHPRDQELLAARRTHWGHSDRKWKRLKWMFTVWREIFVGVRLKRTSGVREVKRSGYLVAEEAGINRVI